MDDVSSNKIARLVPVDVYPRKRLFAQLDRFVERPVIWVDGPGGAGKSTLVASYVEARSLPCLWYQIDARDGDIATLFYYLGQALERLVPGGATRLPLLTPEYHSGLAAFSGRYFEQLFSQLPRPACLAFDDYHELPASSPLHEVFLQALQMLPPGIRVLITSRHAPPPALIRLRARRRMAGLNWNDLRLTPEETEGIVALQESGAHNPDAMATLHARTQGWVAGLVLLLDGDGHAVPPALAAAGEAPGEIFDYFAWEAFRTMAEPVQDFLLRTAHLPLMTSTMAVQLSGNPHGQRILGELCRSNFFTERHFAQEHFYRYHPLFREFLLLRGNERFSPEEASAIKRAAAEVLLQHGDVESAARVAVDCGAWDLLAELTERFAARFLQQGRDATVRNWLKSLPAEVLDQAPALLFLLGVSTLPVNPWESRGYLEQAFRLNRERGDRSGLFLCWSAVVDTAIHANDYSTMPDWVALLNEVLAENPEYPSSDIEQRVALSLFNAVAFCMPDHPEIATIRERALHLFFAGSVADPNLLLGAGIHLVVHFIYQGDFVRARSVLEVLQGAAGAPGASELVLILVKTIEAHFAFATGDLPLCSLKVAEALQLSKQSGIHLWNVHLHGHALAAALARGDRKEIRALLSAMAAGLDGARKVDKAYFYWMKGWDFALEKRFPEARHFLEQAQAQVYEVRFLVPEILLTITLAEQLLELGEVREAERTLEEISPQVLAIGSGHLQFCFSLAEAYLAMRCEKEQEMRAALTTALRSGRECQIENIFFWRPTVMAELCLKAFEAGIETDYVSKLVRRRRLMPETPPVHLEGWPWPVKVYTLGTFAVEIDGERLEFSGKVQKKPLELLKFVVAQGGDEVAEESIADALWPDADGDAARQAFKITLHRLRQLLRHEQGVVLKNGRVSLDQRLVWVDVRLFEAGQVPAPAAERLFALYRGPFLAGETAPWAQPRRESLQRRYLALSGQRSTAPAEDSP